MKLLLDNNLPVGLVSRLVDYSLPIAHVAKQNMERTSDADLWKYALASGDIIVTRDSDFYHRSRGSRNSPKIIWVRMGNCTTDVLEKLLRERQVEILTFVSDAEEVCMILAARKQSR